MNILKKTLAILPKQHIFLISHMRANTSLFGHILGSSDEVSGYYEMHIGYYSWKSLIREKLIYHNHNKLEPVTKYYFDKILHNEHCIDESILNRNNCRFIFMVRKPEDTINSICDLYSKNEPSHHFSTIDGAVDYYITRLKEMNQIFNRIGRLSNCYYLDAESLIDNAEYELSRLTDWLGLKSELTQEYHTFSLTGKAKYGDSSESINHGKIVRDKKNIRYLHIEASKLREACDFYNTYREAWRTKLR